MKKLLSCVVLFMFSASCLFASPVLLVTEKGSNKVLGQYTYEQFRSLIEGAAYTSEMVTAEKSGRVRAYTDKIPWTIGELKEYDTVLHIEWFDVTGKVFKSMKIEIKLTINSQGYSVIRVAYRNIAEQATWIEALIIVGLMFLIMHGGSGN